MTRPAQSIVGVVMANEFLDALPVHRVTVVDGRLRSSMSAGRTGVRRTSVGELSDRKTGRLVRRSGHRLAEGQVRRSTWPCSTGWPRFQRRSSAATSWSSTTACRRPSCTGRERLTGTLRAFRSHHVSSDVLGGVGRQDLTAHVDLDALEAGARQPAWTSSAGRPRRSSWSATGWRSCSKKRAARRARIGPGSSS